MTKGVGDEFGLDAVPASVFRVRVVVLVDGRVGLRPPQVESSGDASQSFGGAEHWIRGGHVAYGFSFDGVLLVSEGE